MPFRDTLANRFWKKVDKSGGPDSCWVWTGARYGTGYGQIRIGGTLENGPGSRQKAHRVSLALAGFDIEEKHTHHTCRNRLCVNPAHLELLDDDEHHDLHADEIRIWTRQRIIDAVLECAEIIGEVPAATHFNPAQARILGLHDRAELFYSRRWPSYTSIVAAFGRWSVAVSESGLQPRKAGRPRRMSAT